MNPTQGGEQTPLAKSTEGGGGSANDLPLVLILLIVSIGTIISSLSMPRPGGWATAPGLFPLIVGIVLLGMGIGLLSMVIRSRRFSLSLFSSKIGDGDRVLLIRIFVAIVGILLYALVLMPLVHFTIATIVYLIGTLWYFWRGKLYKILIISVLVSLFLAETFSRIFQIILP